MRRSAVIRFIAAIGMSSALVLPGGEKKVSNGSAAAGDIGAIIPADRRIDWTHTTGVPGGIPEWTRICATIDAATYGTGVAFKNIAITAGATKGSTDLTLAEISDLAVGQLIGIDRFVGLEDMSVDHAPGKSGASYMLDQCYGCWVRGMSSYKPGGYHTFVLLRLGRTWGFPRAGIYTPGPEGRRYIPRARRATARCSGTTSRV